MIVYLVYRIASEELSYESFMVFLLAALAIVIVLDSLRETAKTRRDMFLPVIVLLDDSATIDGA